ncbi:MAG: response regulator transcription factor [Desulfarculaceae bacterium]|nr:response regulator transcription factor [Desulfarculaceae bacterium]
MRPGNAIQALIATDNIILRRGMARMLGDCQGVQVVSELSSGQEVIKQIEGAAPDVALIDYYLPGLGGLEVAARLADKKSSPRVILFSTYALRESSVFLALEAGVAAVLDKSCGYRDLVAAVKAAAEGKTYLPPALSAQVLGRFGSWMGRPNRGKRGEFASLTPREREVMQLIAEGLTYTQIADQLCISPNTVNRHRASLMDKLNLKSVADIVKFAIEARVVRLDGRAFENN